MNEALVESLRAKRQRLNAEAKAIRPKVEESRARLQEYVHALENAIRRVDQCDAEIREALKGG